MRTKMLIAVTSIALTAATFESIAATHSAMVDGQVTRVDQSAGKITIRHGPMPKFQLDAGHTMVFRAQDPAMLKGVKAGDKIKFEADRMQGQFTVTKIQKAN